MTIELAPEAEAALERIAATSAHSQTDIVTQAMQSYAAWLQFEQTQVKGARADAAAGRVIEHDELFAQLEREYGDKADLDPNR